MSRRCGAGAPLGTFGVGLVALLFFLASAPPASAAVFTVTNTADAGAGSLRQAILSANAAPGDDQIEFNIAGAGVHTITPTSAVLPPITGPVLIDGTSEPGYAGTPLIQLDGSSFACACSGLVVLAPSTIRGLAVTSWPLAGIHVQGKQVAPTLIEDNRIGTNPAGTAAAGNDLGVLLRDTVEVTVEDNVVSGNTCACTGGYGVLINGKSKGNIVRRNLIGLNAAGTTAIPNSGYGVYVNGPKNVIGGSTPSEGNVISGNGSIGLLLVSFTGGGKATANLVANNLVGTNAAGTAARPNGAEGIVVQTADATTLLDNVVSGNTLRGIYALNSKKLVIDGDLVGTNAAGTAAIGNGSDGIALFNTPGARVVSGSNPTIVSGNAGDGLQISNAPGTQVLFSGFGVDITAAAAIPNGAAGIHIVDTVGGVTVAQSVISGNTGDGVYVQLSPANKFLGNLVGLDGSAAAAIPNGGSGIRLAGPKNVIGGIPGGFPTLASGNTGYGIVLEGPGQNTITGTGVGYAFTGGFTVGNGAGGILVSNSAGNRIGPGKISGPSNVIWGNTGNGILLQGASSNGNRIGGNFVGAIDGTGPGNTIDGIWFQAGADQNLVQSNQIANNTFNGVSVSSGATGNALRKNPIAGNGDFGIDLNVDGVTGNDAGDGDSGGNDLQNKPTITGYTNLPGKVEITGVLGSMPGTTYSIDFYANGACDGSGFGEGATYLGTKKVKTPASGPVSFTAKLKSASAVANITATATDRGGNTSEFSNCLP